MSLPERMSDQRLADLEIKCAYLEKTVAELSDVLWKQQQQLDGLVESHKNLKERVAADPGLVDASRHDRPPHY